MTGQNACTKLNQSKVRSTIIRNYCFEQFGNFMKYFTTFLPATTTIFEVCHAIEKFPSVGNIFSHFQQIVSNRFVIFEQSLNWKSFSIEIDSVSVRF